MRNTQDLRGENIIDSRDLIARRDYLAEERETLADELAQAEENVKFHHCGVLDPDGAFPEHEEYRMNRDSLAEWDSGDEAEELRDIEAFLEEGTREFQHGETLILDSYFEDYARELAEDVSDYNARSESWPFTCIDWEKAARELQYDYASAELGSYTYWFRNC